MFNELALFAGGGGGLLASRLLGWRTVGACEINPYRRKVLLARQMDGSLGRFPIWEDVRTFDGKPWKGLVDVVSGGFPCQDISAAGRGKGLGGDRSGLWFEMLRVIREVDPLFVFAENSPLLNRRGLNRVLSDLSEVGYNARWCVLGAHHLGAPQKRDRLWVLAYSDRERGGAYQERGSREDAIDSNESALSEGCEDAHSTDPQPISEALGGFSELWETKPGLGRVVDGMAYRLDRVSTLGDGQVPAVAATAWNILTSNHGDSYGE